MIEETGEKLVDIILSVGDMTLHIQTKEKGEESHILDKYLELETITLGLLLKQCRLLFSHLMLETTVAVAFPSELEYVLLGIHLQALTITSCLYS